MKQLLTYLLILSGFAASAQSDSVAVAHRNLTEGNLERARIAIDAAAEHEETTGDPQTWYVRGFVYKELYNKNERTIRRSPSRDIAFESFRHAIVLDTANVFGEDNRKNIRYLAATYFNDATLSMEPSTVEDAIWYYERFKIAMSVYDPLLDLTPREIEFKNALASVYTKIYDADQITNEPYFAQIENLYREVLQTDPNNISANYNLAILYYNKAVNIINSLDYDMDMFAFMEVQENCVEIFKQSLPFMEKAYDLDPQRKETLVGLSGIYFSLNEMEKSEEIKKRLAEIEDK